MDQVILFEKRNFHGNHKHVFTAEANLNASDDDSMNDETRSIVIIEGEWQFFKDWNFSSNLGTLGPGVYPDIGTALGSDASGAISSLRPVVSSVVKGNVNVKGKVAVTEKV